MFDQQMPKNVTKAMIDTKNKIRYSMKSNLIQIIDLYETLNRIRTVLRHTCFFNTQLHLVL